MINNLVVVQKGDGLFSRYGGKTQRTWLNKTIIYHIPQEEGLLAYEGHVNPLGNRGVYTFTYSLYPFVQNPVAMQLADNTTYIPGFVKANLLDLSPFTPKTSK